MEHYLENFSMAASLGLSYVTDHVLDINWLLVFILVAFQLLEFLLSDEILVWIQSECKDTSGLLLM